jgi:hypothetical protein
MASKSIAAGYFHIETGIRRLEALFSPKRNPAGKGGAFLRSGDRYQDGLSLKAVGV